MLIIRLLVSAAAIMLAAFLVPGVTVSFVPALIAALVLGLLNVFIKPILVVLTLPINILTLGLFTFIINAVLILLVSRIVPGFDVVSFGSALLFAVVLAIINIIFFHIA